MSLWLWLVSGVAAVVSLPVVANEPCYGAGCVAGRPSCWISFVLALLLAWLQGMVGVVLGVEPCCAGMVVAHCWCWHGYWAALSVLAWLLVSTGAGYCWCGHGCWAVLMLAWLLLSLVLGMSGVGLVAAKFPALIDACPHGCWHPCWSWWCLLVLAGADLLAGRCWLLVTVRA